MWAWLNEYLLPPLLDLVTIKMEYFKNIDSFLVQLHPDPPGFNFGTVFKNLYEIVFRLPVRARRMLFDTDGENKDDVVSKQNHFSCMVDFINECVNDSPDMVPYVRHLLALFEYIKNDSPGNLNITKMSKSEPFLNLKFRVSNIYSTMCSPRRFVNQIKNSEHVSRSFDKYTKPEFISEIAELVTYSMINDDGKKETQSMLDDCSKLIVDETEIDGIDELAFEELYFKRMYRHFCEISLQSEIYAISNTNAITKTESYPIFLNFKII